LTHLHMLRTTLLAAVTLAFTACDRGDPGTAFTEPPPVQFGTGTVRIATASDTFAIQVEVAETDQQRRVGMMRRPSLPEEEGMIFLFDEEQPPEGTFWMFNTLIPLTIAFIDADGRIGSIREMPPCPSPVPEYCPQFASGVPFRSALEVNPGYFENRGIGVGDRVILER
jgi:uncharacterized protein